MSVKRNVVSKVIKTENIVSETNVPVIPQVEQAPAEEKVEKMVERSDRRDSRRDNRREETFTLSPRPKKKCLFCTKKLIPAYWDMATLKRYVNDRGRIVARGRSGLCSKHQKRVATNIKYARHLALIPFSVKI